MSKILYVSSAVQKVLMEQIFIPQLMDGFWKNHRPKGHGEVWADVQVEVAGPDQSLGPVGFVSPRNYNFLNYDYCLPNEDLIVKTAQSVKPSSTFKSIKKELLELSCIVGARLKDRNADPIILYRGNHRPGTITSTTSKKRSETGIVVVPMTDEQRAAKVQEKKTVVKKVLPEGGKVINTSNGATVRYFPAPVSTVEDTEEVN